MPNTMEQPASKLIRATRYGKVKGKQWCAQTLAWLGIPYAKPPIGDLRWKAPQDPENWDGILETTEFQSECMQYGGLLLTLEPEVLGHPVGSEDCLYLNVWRPDTTEQELPVFFYLHGGLNAVGEGATSLYHGATLAKDNKVIVVTINYRLGIFGWFAHKALKTGNPLDDSGNYGLLDYVKALQWVHANISAFGGDKNNVTIIGESAGAFNVITLLAMPLAKGLFHKAISISPMGSFYTTSMNAAYKKSQTQLQRMLQEDGTVNTPRGGKWVTFQRGKTWVADYLRSKSAKELLLSTKKLTAPGLNEGLGITFDILGGSRILDGTVLPLDFSQRFKSGNYQQVPYMIGSASDEMRIFELSLGFLSKPDDKELSHMIRSYDPARSDLELSTVVPAFLQPLYAFIGSVLGAKVFEKTGVDPVADRFSRHQEVYVFKFCWNQQPTPFNVLVGASHMMALPFIFGNFQNDAESLFRISWSEENKVQREVLSEKMRAYLANFMQTGNPNEGAYPQTVKWETWSNQRDQRKRIIFDTSISMSNQ
ncbi:carboxylesterase family protein [Deltaproteobacteria bacterium TL4]